jgi:KDO2-lipid IV(A) lauroyltransferase
VGKRRKHLPPVVEVPLAAGIRLAMTPALLMGLPGACSAARSLGALYPALQPSRFQRAVRNLRDAFPLWNRDRVEETARRCYQHLFQLGAELLFVPRLVTREAYGRHLVFDKSVRRAAGMLLSDAPVILITGHVGNWELVGYAMAMLGFPLHAVYRPLDLRPLDEWVRDTRQRRGLTLVNKFGAMRALPEVLRARKPVGLVADQSGGDRGIFVPFFGRLTSTYKSVGMLALHARANLVCGFARRLEEDEPAPAGLWEECPGPPERTRWDYRSLRYSVEIVDVFGPDDYMSQPDPLYYLTARYRRAIEMMVRRAPEQYFWMHRVWRSRPLHERTGAPFPPRLREKLASLPWMTPADVEAVVDRSERDRENLARLQR